MSEQTPRITIIGLGFLMRYMKPCFEALTGDAYGISVVGTTATEASIPAKQAEMGIHIYHHNELAVLNTFKPDIIMFAPPPSAVADLTRDVLVPYYRDLQAKKRPLPDLYAFAPDPRVEYYQTQLGNEGFYVNILPNMTFDLSGIAPECYSVVTYPDYQVHNVDKIARVETFLSPLGSVLNMPSDWITPFIGGYVVCHLVLNFAFACYDALAAAGHRVSMEQISDVFQDSLSNQIISFDRSNEGGIEFVCRLVLKSFQNGIVSYYAQSGISEGFARNTITVQLKAFVERLRSETRENLIRDSQNHATKGGLLENAERYFHDNIHAELLDRLSSPEGDLETLSEKISQFAYDAAAFISAFSDGYSGITGY